MNTLKIEKLLAEKYKYKPLAVELSKKYHDFFHENIPEFLKNNSKQIDLFSGNGTLICNGYERIVIGDYGAFIEFNEQQANTKDYIIKQGQEYRVYDTNYKDRIKYVWLTLKDKSDVKIYKQNKTVTYADYKIGMYYVSVHEVKI